VKKKITKSTSERKANMTTSKGIDNTKVVKLLNRILEEELAGVVRYTHYSFMIFGYNRIPIVSWFRSEANTSLGHAHQAGEMLTHMGEHPSLAIGHLLETHKHDISEILNESLEAERTALNLYKELLEEVQGRSIFLEDYARNLIFEEETHAGEVDKMLRNPGAVKRFAGSTPGH
jgi:bacterioferritin